jgi:hypothetical protein
MEIYLCVVFGGAFFVSVSWGWYWVGYVRGWDDCNREVTVGKKEGGIKRNGEDKVYSKG